MMWACLMEGGRGSPTVRVPMAGHPRWKWIAFALILCVFLLLLRLIYRLSRWSNSRHPFLQSLAHVTLPVYFLAATPVVAYLALVQINFLDTFGSEIEGAATAVMFAQFPSHVLSGTIPPETLIASSEL